MNASDVELVVVGWFWPRNIFVPNIYLNGDECDLLMLAPSGRTTDFEIKISRSDFFADAKKLKHYRYRSAFEHKTTRIKCFGDKCLVPNHFVYVVPETLNIMPSDVPKYAGLWTVKENERLCWSERITRLKEAPTIHKESIDVLSKMARGLWARYAQRAIFAPRKIGVQL